MKKYTGKTVFMVCGDCHDFVDIQHMDHNRKRRGNYICRWCTNEYDIKDLEPSEDYWRNNETI